MKRAALFLLLAAALLVRAQNAGSNSFTGVYQVSSFAGTTLDAKLNACIGAVSSTYGGICDARSFGPVFLAGNVTVSASNVKIMLPCTTITTAYQFIVSPTVTNTAIEGCAFQGGSASGSGAGGTVWDYTGSGAAFQVGDTTHAQTSEGFAMRDLEVDTAGAGSAAQAIAFHRTHEIDLDRLFLTGSSTQTGVYLDGTGDLTNGTFESLQVQGYGTGLYLTGHLSGSATGDYVNGSLFARTEVICGAGGTGVQVVGGSGNVWAAGDLVGCSVPFSWGSNATNNSVVGMNNAYSTGILASSAGNNRINGYGSTVYPLPDTGSSALWVALGTFSAPQNGSDIFVKIVAQTGYNATASQDQVSYIHFKTSDNSSVDPNGFAGDTWWYQTGPLLSSGSSAPQSIQWISNAAGVAATSYTLYAYFGIHTGVGSFYEVDLPPGTSWTNLGTTSSSNPSSGAPAGTYLIPGVGGFVIGPSLTIGTGTNAVVRCTGAPGTGQLPIGTLTTATGYCNGSAQTGLTVQ